MKSPFILHTSYFIISRLPGLLAKIPGLEKKGED